MPLNEWYWRFGSYAGIAHVELVALPLAALAVVWLVHWRRTAGAPSGRAWRLSLAEVGIVYGTAPSLWLTMTPGMPGSGGVSLRPLSDISTTPDYEIVGNLLLLAALGFFAPLRFARLASLWRILALAGACSALIETAQYVLPLNRVASAGDVLLNTAGAGLAALASRPWWRRDRGAAGGPRRLLSLVVVCLVVTACASPTLLHGTDADMPAATKVTRLSTHGWPRHGQGAYVIGAGDPAASPHEKPVPIASLAKVMTAYLVLKHYPLAPGAAGKEFVVSQADVDETDARRHQGHSVVALSAGESLSERDALMAILLPSANNVAVLVAGQVGGSVAAFVAEMNRTAQALGMADTTYTDPSGYDPDTVSTALDQLRLARAAATNATLAGIMATPAYLLPGAGEVYNTDTLLGQDGFVGMKTGSDAAAGGCFMFRSVRPTTSGNVTVIGVVLGQPGRDLISAGLEAAKQLVDRLEPTSATRNAIPLSAPS